MEELLQNKIYACGTVRANRKGQPKNQILDKHFQKGESENRVSSTGISWIKWKDNRCIQFLSNYHDPDHISTCSRKTKDRSKIIIQCPQAVKDYNQHMGYIDHADMLKSCYQINRKSRKWWHRIFFHFVDVAVCNSFILFKQENQGAKMVLKEYRLAIVAGLVGLPTQEKRGRKTPSGGEIED